MASPELQEVIRIFQERVGLGFNEKGEFSLETMRLATAEPQFPPPAYAHYSGTMAGRVPCEWVTAPNSDPDRRLLYLHGGGYVIGSVESYRDLAGRLAQATGCTILNVDYRLAPEHPFPAAVEDGSEALRWMHVNGPAGPSSASVTFVAGDSAGGGLALAVLLSARDAGARPVDGGITISAWTDLAITGASVKAFEKTDPVMGGRVAPEAAMAYVGTASPRDPLASPLYGNFAGIPPLLMQVGAIEVLLDDTRRVAEKARNAGVDVTVEEWPDMVHCWHLYAAILPEARQAIDRIGQWVRLRTPERV